MGRIVYLAFPGARITGGQKMAMRHVETLRELGFDAVYRLQKGELPAGYARGTAYEVGTPIRPDDIVVVPEDAPNAISQVGGLPNRMLIFCQNQFYFAASGAEAVDRLPPERRPDFMTPGRIAAEMVGRMYPHARIDIVRSFADERVFFPRPDRNLVIAVSPRKRPLEAKVIKTLFRKAYPQHAHIPWLAFEGATEEQVAQAFGTSAIFLSLSRFEAAPITPLEAMASGCVCAGFRGIGGEEHSNPTNGFWAPDDDCEAAADALARAADLVKTGGPPLERYREAGRATAAEWSYANFRPMLEEVWMRLAPEMRRRDGPLD